MSTDTDYAWSRRQSRRAEINAQPADRQTLETRYGRVWDPMELRRDYFVLGFLAPLVVVRRNTDGTWGSLEFQHAPRFYFNWKEDA